MDNPEAGLLLVSIFFFIFINGFLALSETAITESHKGRLEKLADEGSQKAVQAIKLLESPEKLLSVVQICITLTSILLGTLAGALLAPYAAQHLPFLPYAGTLSLIGCILCVTYATLLFGEFLPKALALQNPEHFLMHNLAILIQLERLTRPSVAFLSASANTVLLLFGISTQREETVTEDEVKDLIEQATEEGTFEKTEQAMVDRIFRMSDQTAYSLMTPRTQMFWLDLDDPLEENLRAIQENPQTLFPVAKNNLDNFLGILYAKDLLNATLDHKELNLADYIKKPMVVPRSLETFRVLENFQETGIREAIVLDEYGGVIGFITLDDILQEIIGDAPKPDEPDTGHITPCTEDSWYIDGLYSIDDFKEKFSIDKELPDEEHDHYQTMGGFLTSYFGYLPQPGETCQWEGFSFKILSMDRARISRILMTRKTETAPPASASKPA